MDMHSVEARNNRVQVSVQPQTPVDGGVYKIKFHACECY
jgi:hypothetical protein